VQNDIGVAQFELGQFGEAASSFNRAHELSPGFREALFNRAVAQKANLQYAEAVRSFEEFIETNPEGDWRSEAERNVRRLKGLLPSPD
jgi:tetratricopeptide (TPR) repeat protein